MLNPAQVHELQVLEERLAVPGVEETRETLGALLAAEFREIGSSGRLFTAASVLDAILAVGRPRLMLEEFTVVAVADGAALVTYVSKSVAGPGWKAPSLRSSLWVRRENRWQLLFHQGTRLGSEEA